MPHFDAFTSKQRSLLDQLHRESVYDAHHGRHGHVLQLPDGLEVDALSLHYVSLIHDRLRSALEWMNDLTLIEGRFVIARCELGYAICLYEVRRMDEDISLYFDVRREGLSSGRGMIGCRVFMASPWGDMLPFEWTPILKDY